MDIGTEQEESTRYSPLGSGKSHDSQNSTTSPSRLKKIINAFNPWSSQSPASNPVSSAGANRRVRKIGLRPRSKVVRDAIQKPGPIYYMTEMGRRRLPRGSHQLRPTAQMIQEARRGHLTKFLRQGDIVRADDFGEDMVNPRTAEIYLDYDNDFVTDHLSDESEDMDDELKDTNNLYYISVQRDELPTYHFWQRETDPDPLRARRPIDWGAVFEERLPAVLAEEEREGLLNGHSFGRVKPNPSNNMIENAWMPGGKHHRAINPKRSVRPALSNRTANNASSQPEWKIQGSIAGLVWNSSNNGISDGSRQCGPQPGDSEWEVAEQEWETRLRDAKTLKAFLTQYRRDDGDKYAELTAPRTSPVLRPVHGNDPGTQRHNAILKTAVPTVAFKLTQQHFGRPVSSLQGNEPLCKGEDPTDWKAGEDSYENPRFAGGKLVYHKDEPLEFLDFYDQSSYGQPMIRLRKPIPEEYIHREPPYRCGIVDNLDVVGQEYDNPLPQAAVGLKNAFAASKKSKPSASAIILQGDTGGLYLHQRTYESFLATARKLLPTSVDKGARLVFWVDILRADATQVKPVKIDIIGGRTTFEASIMPLLTIPTCAFRIRHTGDPNSPFKNSKYTGSSIRLHHESIGYVYVAVKWIDEIAGHIDLQHPSSVMTEAISFLSPEASANGMRVTLVIPDEGSHDVDFRNGANAAVKARLQAILRGVTEANKANTNPVEVQICESTYPAFEVSTPKPPSSGHVGKPGPSDPPTGTTGQTGQPPQRPPVPFVPGPTQPPRRPPKLGPTQPPPKRTGPSVPPYSPSKVLVRKDGEKVNKVILIRPARGGAAELTAPFSAQRFLDQVQELYRPLGHDWTLRVFTTETAWINNQYFQVKANIMTDAQAAQDFVEEFQQGLEQNGLVYIYKELPTAIRVNNGTGASRTSELWDHRSDATGTDFARIASILTGVQPQRNTGGIRIRVHKHTLEGENLYWNNFMSDDQFRTYVYYKIDDPEIDIYPTSWVPDGHTFDEVRMAAEKLPLRTAEERAKLQKEQEENDARWLEESDEKYREYDAKLAARLGPESIYGKDSGEIRVPKYGPSLEPEIRGGLDLPSTYARVLTLSEINRLQINQQRAENELLQREASCRICDAKFSPGVSDIKAHYAKHKEGQVQRCPFCERNWTTWSIEERTSHLRDAHFSEGVVPQREVCPDCGIDVSNVKVFPNLEAVMKHVKKHHSSPPAQLPEVICDYPDCGFDMSHLSDQGRIDHAKTHPRRKPGSVPYGADGGDGGGDNGGGERGKEGGEKGVERGGEKGGEEGGEEGGEAGLEGGEEEVEEEGEEGGEEGGKKSGEKCGEVPEKGNNPKKPTGGKATRKGNKGSTPYGHWMYCPTCAVRYSSKDPESMRKHAKIHNIEPEAFKRFTPQEAQAIRANFKKHGRTDNKPQPKDDSNKGNNGKGKAGNGKNGNGKQGGSTPVTGKGANGKTRTEKGTPGRKKRTRSQVDDDDDEGDEEDELLNPPHLRSPKRKRGKAAPDNGQPQRQSKRLRRAPVRISTKA